MGHLRGVGVFGRQVPDALPVQAPAAEEAEYHADVVGVVVVLRQGLGLHLIDRQGLAGRAHHADAVVAVFPQRFVQHRQGGGHLEAAAGAGADLLRGGGQDALGLQTALGAGHDRRVDEALFDGQLHQGGHGSAVLGAGPDGRVRGPGQVQAQEGADLRQDGIRREELPAQRVKVGGHPGAKALAAAVLPLAVKVAEGPALHGIPIGAHTLAGTAAGAEARLDDLGIQCDRT